MKRKTIQKELEKIHASWCKSIKDETVKKAAEQNTIITGGCIASMLLGEEVNDYDMYFRDKETVKLIAEYYAKQVDKISFQLNTVEPAIKVLEESERISLFIKSQGIIKFNSNDKKVFKPFCYLPIFVTQNAITLSDKVQLIVRFYGEPEEIHSNYDFEHCKSWWDSKSKQLVIPGPSAEALLARELKYTGSKYPLASIIRTRKFIKRGWSITAGEYVKMAIQLNSLDLLNINVLKDQLVGVDLSYFQAFIAQVEKDSQAPDFKLSGGYLCQVIDQIFDETHHMNGNDD